MNLIHGDCLEELPKLPDKSVDLFFLDLPYGQIACSWDVKIDLDQLWSQLKRLAKNERTPFFFSCTTKFGYELIKSNPTWFRWDLVWKKNRASGFLNAYKLPMRQHEMIYCFAKKCPEYDTSSHSEKTVKAVKDSKKAEIYGVRRAATNTVHKDKLPTSDITPTELKNSVYRKEDGSGSTLYRSNTSGTKMPTSDITPGTWCEYKLDEKTGHRTAKPVKLMEFILKYWTKEGDTVCDPTAGSGSMGIACKNMNRKFIGIEMDDEIYQLMEKRIHS